MARNGANQFLLTKRAIEPFSGLWHFAGGRVEYKESILGAIQRIAKKEVGTSVEIGKLAGFCDILNDGEFVHSVSLVFSVTLPDDKVVLDEQASQFAWFDLAPDNTHPYQLEFLRSIGR